jgi:peroxiredoxin
VIGEFAPDFTLRDQNAAPLTLSDYRGNNSVVLIFYVLDDTPG